MKQNLYKIVVGEGFTLTEQLWAYKPVYAKGEERIVYDPKLDREIIRYNVEDELNPEQDDGDKIIRSNN